MTKIKQCSFCGKELPEVTPSGAPYHSVFCQLCREPHIRRKRKKMELKKLKQEFEESFNYYEDSSGVKIGVLKQDLIDDLLDKVKDYLRKINKR